MNRLVVIAFALVIVMASCEEEPLPIIEKEGPAPLLDTTYQNASVSAPQDKVVLFEDFTGVRCPTCPNGHKALKDMMDANPGRIVGIAIHPGGTEFNQAAPFKDQEDYNTQWGTQIFTIISKPNGIPYGIADRVNGSNLATQWISQADAQLAVPNPANTELRVISFDESTRELRFEVKFEITSDINEPLFFSTVITEDSLIGKQEYTQGEYEHYVHMHVLRDMPQFALNLNPGNNPPATAGRVFLKQFSYTLPENWNVEHCNLIAYIHKPVEVIQAAEIHLK